MHPAAWNYVCGVIREKRLGGDVVELGSLDVNGSIRYALHHATSYVGVDLRSGPGVDVVADAADYQPDALVDVVVCMETLEHAPNWRDIIENAASMLRPGGTFIVTAAGPQRAPHGCDGMDVGDEYYGNISPQDLADALASHFAAFDAAPNPKDGDVYGWGVKAS